MGTLCRALAEEAGERAAQNAESLAGFIESLVEKHEDKYEKAKYARLVRMLLERSHTFLFLFAAAPPAACLPRLRCIDALLRAHLPTKPLSRLSHEDDPPSDACPLQPALADALSQWLTNHHVHEFHELATESPLTLVAYYRLVKSALAVEPALVEAVLTPAFLRETLEYMQKDRNNNILHNYQREVLLAGVRESDRVWQCLQEELGLESLVASTLTDRNSADCCANQLFLIAEAVRARSLLAPPLGTPAWSTLASAIDSKRQFYSALIGGNPRAEDKWDSMMDNDNELILKSLNQRDAEDKQVIEERIEV